MRREFFNEYARLIRSLYAREFIPCCDHNHWTREDGTEHAFVCTTKPGAYVVRFVKDIP